MEYFFTVRPVSLIAAVVSVGEQWCGISLLFSECINWFRCQFRGFQVVGKIMGEVMGIPVSVYFAGYQKLICTVCYR